MCYLCTRIAPAQFCIGFHIDVLWHKWVTRGTHDMFPTSIYWNDMASYDLLELYNSSPICSTVTKFKDCSPLISCIWLCMACMFLSPHTCDTLWTLSSLIEQVFPRAFCILGSRWCLPTILSSYLLKRSSRWSIWCNWCCLTLTCVRGVNFLLVLVFSPMVGSLA